LGGLFWRRFTPVVFLHGRCPEGSPCRYTNAEVLAPGAIQLANLFGWIEPGRSVCMENVKIKTRKCQVGLNTYDGEMIT
jgi:hypothetical protein